MNWVSLLQKHGLNEETALGYEAIFQSNGYEKFNTLIENPMGREELESIGIQLPHIKLLESISFYFFLIIVSFDDP